MSAVRTTCPYCGVGCGIVARADEGAGPRSFAIDGDPGHPSSFGRLCSKGAALAETLGLDGRLLHPIVHGKRTGWDEALDAVAHGFARAIAAHGPDAVAFYVSGQLLTEDYYVANKLMKGFIGSANIDTNSRLCMASAVAGHKRAFGADVVPAAYDDIEAADLFVIVGSNTAWCHPVLFQRIRATKARRPDVRVIVVDPRRTATADIADLLLQIRPGTDAVLFNGLLSHASGEGALDRAYLEAHVEGADAALRAARETAPSIQAVARACGVREADVAELYRAFSRTERVLTLFSQGVNQSSSGTDKVNAIINAHLATGKIGKRGAGPFSLTGQPNAMGGREIGALATQLAAHMDFTPENVARLARFWGASDVARRPGLAAVELFDAMHRGRIKAVWIMATNPAVSMPDAGRVAEALERCELVVVSDCMRCTDTAALADVLLPASGWGEKSGTVTSSERRISRQRAFMRAAGESRPDWWIVAEVARRMGFGDAFAYRSPAEIFREHARLSAYENDGARAFDIGALAALGDVEYDALEPVAWPCPAGGRGLTDGARPFADGRFFTTSGKARLVPVLPLPPRHAPSAAAPFALNTGRVRDHWHTMTRTGLSERLSGHHAEPFVQVHPIDAEHRGLASGDLAEVVNERGRMIARVVVTADVEPGCPFAPMHWNAQYASAGRVGVLIAAAVDPVSGQPELKHAPVELRRYAAAWHAFAISREPLAVPDAPYAARAKRPGCWRYELAGDTPPESWPRWAHALLGGDGDWVQLSDAKAGRYRAARFDGPRLEACVYVAPGPLPIDRELIVDLVGVAHVDAAARSRALAGRPAAGSKARGGLVCACFSIGYDVLADAIRTQSLTTAAEVGRVLGAGTRCGSCIPELNALLGAAARPASAR